MEYKCSVCKEEVEGDLLIYVDHTEKHIVDEIKANHPQWAESDGMCKKCIDHYRNQMKGNSLR